MPEKNPYLAVKLFQKRSSLQFPFGIFMNPLIIIKAKVFFSPVFKQISIYDLQSFLILIFFCSSVLAKKQSHEKFFKHTPHTISKKPQPVKDYPPVAITKIKDRIKREKSAGLYQKSHSILTENLKLKKNITRYFKNKPISKKEIQKFLIKNSYYQADIVQTETAYIIKNPFHITFILKENHFFNEKEIRKFIKIDESKMGVFFYNFVEKKIKNIYQNQGFLKITIKKQVVKKQWKKWIYLTLVEGPRIKIEELKIKGLLSKPNYEYENFIKNNSSDLIRKGFYNKKDLEQGYKNLINHLKSQGYLQSKIYSDRIFFKENKAFITVNLEEGPLTLIKDIQIQKARAIPLWEILSHIQSRIHSTLKIDLLREDLHRIEQLYKNKGYLNMKITNKNSVIQYTPGERYVSIVIQIEEGPKALVSKISIKGLKRAKESLVRQLLKFKEGEILTLLTKEQSIRALGETGLWTDVNFSENRVKDQLMVTAHFKERKARSLRGGMGLNSQRGLTTRAYTEFSHRNLFGWGRAFIMRGNGQISLTEKPFLEYEFSGRYKEVFIPSYAYQGDVSLTQSQNVFKYSKKNINFVKKTQISFFINKNISNNLKMKGNIFSFENRREACTVDLNCPEKPQKISTTGFNLVWDKRDNIFDPSNGRLSSMEVELASPFLGSSKDVSFIKATGQQEWYWTLIKNYTLGLTVKGGLIHAFQNKQNIPVSRAFILGGQNSLRGYDGHIEGERIPSQKYAPIETANESLRLQQKGVIEKVRYSHHGLINADFRFPVFEKLKAVLFYDLGLVYLKSLRQKALTYGHSVGIGFRYQTFLIPIGLDIAYKLPPKEGGDYRLHFSIGW